MTTVANFPLNTAAAPLAVSWHRLLTVSKRHNPCAFNHFQTIIFPNHLAQEDSTYVEQSLITILFACDAVTGESLLY